MGAGGTPILSGLIGGGAAPSSQEEKLSSTFGGHLSYGAPPPCTPLGGALSPTAPVCLLDRPVPSSRLARDRWPVHRPSKRSHAVSSECPPPTSLPPPPHLAASQVLRFSSRAPPLAREVAGAPGHHLSSRRRGFYLVWGGRVVTVTGLGPAHLQRGLAPCEGPPVSLAGRDLAVSPCIGLWFGRLSLELAGWFGSPRGGESGSFGRFGSWFLVGVEGVLSGGFVASRFKRPVPKIPPIRLGMEGKKVGIRRESIPRKVLARPRLGLLAHALQTLTYGRRLP